MTTTEEIRRWLQAGETPERIALAFGVRLNRVRVIRWRMRNPDYHRIYMQRWRECNPGAAKRRRTRRMIKAVQERRAAEAQRVQKAIAPTHWYG